MPLDRAGFEPRRVAVSCRAASKILPDPKLFRSVISLMAPVLHWSAGRFHDGSNPARTRVISMAHRGRTEIFALPTPRLTS